jgi:hypothetical protein
VAHAVDNDQQFVGEALSPQTQQAFRFPGDLRWPFTMRRHCMIAAAFLSGRPCHSVHARKRRKKATMQPNFLHTVAGETARVGVRDHYVRVTRVTRVTCAHTPLRASCSQ